MSGCSADKLITDKHIYLRPYLFIWLNLLSLSLIGCQSAPPALRATTGAVPTANLPALDTPAPTPLPNTPTLIPSTTPSPMPLPTLPPSTATPTQAPASSTPLPTATPATAVPNTGPTINNLPIQEFISLNDDVKNNVRAIFQQGQTVGRNPNAFSKLGDSGVLTSHYLTRFDYPSQYELGPHAALQPVVEHFKGSFERYGVAARVGLSSWGVLDPLWADGEWCQPNEHMLVCEFRLYNPAILLIRLGTNDTTSVEALEKNLAEIVIFTMSEGVIPVLATKADRFEGEDNRNNEAIRRVAAAYQLPLWDFDRVAQTLPDKGLTADNVHLTTAASNDFTDPETLTKGYPVSDLSALYVLQAILETAAVNPSEGRQP